MPTKLENLIKDFWEELKRARELMADRRMVRSDFFSDGFDSMLALKHEIEVRPEQFDKDNFHQQFEKVKEHFYKDIFEFDALCDVKDNVPLLEDVE